MGCKGDEDIINRALISINTGKTLQLWGLPVERCNRSHHLGSQSGRTRRGSAPSSDLKSAPPRCASVRLGE